MSSEADLQNNAKADVSPRMDMGVYLNCCSHNWGGHLQRDRIIPGSRIVATEDHHTPPPHEHEETLKTSCGLCSTQPLLNDCTRRRPCVIERTILASKRFWKICVHAFIRADPRKKDLAVRTGPWTCRNKRLPKESLPRPIRPNRAR